ncbi:MAG TPA: cytochrome C biogenesis protein, partial [Bacteroidia bacterium]|nr:cytochrome C biogenesis protein [Bacteroidia bacterium]
MIQYTGEHLLWGQFGQFFIVLAFTAALLSAIAYLFDTYSKNPNPNWKRLGRVGYVLNGFSVVAIFAILYYLIYNHYFEYYYVWHHSSTTLPMQYIFACFWEGQEGSFLLWTFWHVVLAAVVIRTSKAWESSVMSIIMLVQVFLGSMVLGVWLGDVHIGSNPFILLRNHP